jgi:hypothetical protein
MADDQVATKAPENDAAQESPIPGDSVAQEGPSMGVSLGILLKQARLSALGTLRNG